MKIERTVTSSRPAAEVFAYLSDFTTTEEWDPGTIRTTRVSGDGGVGTVYANVSQFRGRPTELTYEVTHLEPERLIRLRGENRTVLAEDTMTFTPTSTGGTDVTYTAQFTLKGVARLAAPFLAGAFRALGDEAEQGLCAALA
ncbi:MAG: SRPBCC family protein [Nocardioides sp.]|uniref:SRPBCC family protein n=1 Tax=Nocardioides sp. TaxID=35761 RepID=UPI003F099C23